MQTVDKIKKLLEPMANERGYYVVEIAYKREGKNFVLRIVLDKKGGITMGECAGLNNELSELFDKENVIEGPYTLEISSPGLDRALVTNEDFVWAVGRKVKLTTYAPFEGKNAFSGTLVGLGDGTVVLNEAGSSIEISREKIAKARLDELSTTVGEV